MNGLLSNDQYRSRNSFDRVPCPSSGCEKYYKTDELVNNAFSDEEAAVRWRNALGRTQMNNKV